MFKLFLLTILFLISAPALAYIGPGAGISVLGSLMGILATIFVAIGAILFWPLRKMLKRRRQAGQAETSPGDSAPATESSSTTSDQS